MYVQHVTSNEAVIRQCGHLDGYVGGFRHRCGDFLYCDFRNSLSLGLASVLLVRIVLLNSAPFMKTRVASDSIGL